MGSNRSSNRGDEIAEAFGVVQYDGASVRVATRRVGLIDEMIPTTGDSVTDPIHQANSSKFPDRHRRPGGLR